MANFNIEERLKKLKNSSTVYSPGYAPRGNRVGELPDISAATKKAAEENFKSDAKLYTALPTVSPEKSEADFNNYLSARQSKKTTSLLATPELTQTVQNFAQERVQNAAQQLYDRNKLSFDGGRVQEYATAKNINDTERQLANAQEMRDTYANLYGSGTTTPEQKRDALEQKNKFDSEVETLSKRLAALRAESAQNTPAEFADATKRTDYDIYSALGAEMRKPQTQSTGDADLDAYLQQIKANADKANAGTQVKEVESKDLMGYMNKTEEGTYNYLLGKFGQNMADSYFNSIEDSLKQRQGGEIAKTLADEQGLARAVQTGGFGLRAGFDQFGSGIRQLGSEEAVSPTSVGYGSQAVRESLADAGPNVLGSSLGQTAYDLVTTTGNMLPSILVSTFAGPAAGTATMGLSAGGNAYTQGLEMGYTPEQARNYATLVGASEGLLQYFLGGIGKLGGKTGLSAKLGGKIAQIENGLARFSANFSKNVLSEATEEGLQAILEPVFRNAITNEGVDINWSEVAYNALLGGLSGGLMGGNAQTNVDTNANTPAVPTAQRDAAVKASLMGQGMSEAKADAILPTVMRVINGDTTLSNNELVKGMPIADARVKAVINQYTGGSIDINETSLGKLKSQYRAVIEANAPGQWDFDAGADAANAASVSATAEQTGTEGENMTLENGGEKNYNEVKQNEMEGMTDGTETGRSESGSGDRQRAYSVAASEPGSGVQSGTGSPEARRAASQQRGENFRNNAETAGIQEVSTASFGIPGGTDTKSVRVLTEQLWDDGLRAIYADQQSKGRDVTFVVGAMEFEDADGAYTVRGAISEDGNKMWIRADHADLTPEQIVAHEEFHGLQMSDPELVARTVAQIDADYEGALRALAEAYVDEYGWTDVSDDYVFEEILCDAYAGIDIFDYIGGSNIYQFADTARNMAAQSQAAINEARGTSKYSIESLPDGKKYVRAERQVIFGNDPEAWGEQVERYINKEIREGKDVQLIAEDGDILTLTADTAGKAKYRYKPNGQPMTNEEYETKLNAEAHIDELALVSRRGKRTADDYGGVHGDMASRGWNYRTVFFRDFDGKYYRLYISVAQGADGNVVYHIGNIEERSFPNVIGSSAKNDGALKGKASSDARLPREGKNVNSKFSRDIDRSYMNAVDSGDTEAAQRMVDAAAEAAMPNSKIRGKDGKLLPVYHGTTEMFNVFDTSIKGGTNGTAEGFGIYTSDDTAVTSNYGQRQLKLYANIEKPATDTKKTITAVKLAKLIEDTCKREAEVIVEEGYDNINDAIKDTWISNYVNTYNMPMSRAYRDAAYGILRFSDSDLEVIQEVMSGMGIRDYEAAYDFYHNSLIPVTGFDGFITHWDNKDNSQIILAIDSRQLKYADPVTYDDDGNVIPLSERFNSENDDIRYSRDPIRKERTAQEREKLQSTLEAVRSAAPETFEERRRSTNNSPVDNTETEAYNEINNDKEGQSYVQTDEFRQLQEESARLLESNSGRGYGLSVDEEGRIRVAGVLQRELESRRRGGGDSQWATVTLGDSSNPQRQYNMLEDVDGQTFRDFFEIARRYTGNGELVDLHNTETTEDGIGYDDCYNYLSEDGLSGFSITSDGDLISVFNAKDINGKGGFLKAIAPLVKERASTLDCFASPNQNLVQMYEKAFGFKTASVMDYNMEYDHDNIAANHNMPQVAFMVNSNTDIETRHFTEDQWDEAKAYQMQKAEETQRDRRAYELFRDSSPRYSMSLEGDEAAERGRGNIRPEDVRLKRTMEAFHPKPKEVTPERELTPEEQLRLERTMDAFRPKGTPSRYAVSAEDNTITDATEKRDALEVVSKLKNALPLMAKDISVAQLTGKEFERKQGQKLSAQVAEMFNNLGNAISRNGFGNVLLNMRGIKSDIAHGVGRAKAITFAAVPQVIEKGRQIDFVENWKGRGYDSYIFAAPVDIGESREYVAAVVLKDPQANRFYLHEVVDENGNVVIIKNDNIPEAFKTRSGGEPRVTGASEMLSEDSITSSEENRNSEIGTDTIGVGAAEAGFTNAEPTRTAPTQSRGVTNSNWMDEQTKRAAAPKAHEVISEANSLAGAKQYIYTDDAGNIVNFEDSVKNLLETDGWGPKESDAAMLLMQEAAKRKNWDDVRSLATRYNEVGTKSAQALQARKKWVGETPEDRIVGILRAVDKLQKQYGDRKAQKGVKINISDELLDEYYAAKDDAARDAVIVKMQNDVASKIKPSLMDKWTALRYVNMLGNFKTQGRNLLGNTFMAGLSFAQNEFATLGEVIANAATGGKVGRTKSALVGRDWMQAAKADYDNVKSALLVGGKYNDRAYTDDFTEGVENKRTIFSNKTPLEWYRKGTNWAMEGGDRIFAKSAYARALAGYLKANGVTAEQLDAGAVSEDMMDAAREYAINRAQQQTFRDNNAFSTWVSRIGRRPDTPKAARAIAEGLAPFRKTPANVMVRAMEYSPLGLVETAVKSVQKAKGNENVSGTDIVDSLSKNLTGAGLMALGFMLSELGVLNSGADEEDQSVDQMINKQAYSINLPNGATYTIDWAAPASLLLFMGSTMQELASDEELTFKDLEYVFTSMADPMIEMSMLSGINDTLDGIKYSDNSIMQMVASLALGYLSQGLTNTLLGQIERTAEPNRMKTYVDAESSLPDWVQRSIGKASAKIRGWDYNQTEYLDEFGNPESNGSVVRRAFENFVSPGYYEESNRDKPAYAFAEWAHDTLGKDYFPEAYVDSKTDYDNETYTLTQEEKDRWQATRGGIAEGYLEAASQSEAFAALPAELQKSVLAQLKKDANAAAKSEMLANRGIEEDIGDATVSERELSAAEAVDYQIYKKTFNQLNEAKNQSAENISAMGKLMEDFDSLSPATQNLLMDTEGFSKYYDSLEAGISTKDYYAVKTAVAEAPVPELYKTQPNWNKDMTVVSMDIPEEEKLAAIKLSHNGDSTADKYQLAYNEGITLEDIAAYYALHEKRIADEDTEDGYRKLTNSERRREAREQGIDAYSKLERIWGYDKDTLARKLG